MVKKPSENIIFFGTVYILGEYIKTHIESYKEGYFFSCNFVKLGKSFQSKRLLSQTVLNVDSIIKHINKNSSTY